MRQLLVAAATAATVLLPAAPATTGTAPVPVVTSSDPRDDGREALRVLPEPFDRIPTEGCTVPAGAGLEACPPDSRRGPVVSCVLPLRNPVGTVVVPECPRPDPFPRGRVVPVSR